MTATPVVAGQAVRLAEIVVCFRIARCNIYTWFCPFLFHRISIISDSFFCGQATKGHACQISYSAHCVYQTINAVQKRRIPPAELLRQDTPAFILLRQQKRTELPLYVGLYVCMSVCLSVCLSVEIIRANIILSSPFCCVNVKHLCPCVGTDIHNKVYHKFAVFSMACSKSEL